MAELKIHTEYLVDRTTTDKLQETLNQFAGKGWRVSWQYVGGRDWVVIAEGQAVG